MGASKDRLACFKAYDIRGRIPDELNRDLVFKIGRAYAAFTGARRVDAAHRVAPAAAEAAAIPLR